MKYTGLSAPIEAPPPTRLLGARGCTPQPWHGATRRAPSVHLSRHICCEPWMRRFHRALAPDSRVTRQGLSRRWVPGQVGEVGALSGRYEAGARAFF